MRYIDAEKLIAEIERQKSLFSTEKEKEGLSKTDKLSLGARIASLEETIVLIDSLQQEQPEVDLKKEIETYFKGWYMDETDQGYILHTPDDHAGLMSVKQVARHFYELGLNAKEEKI